MDYYSILEVPVTATQPEISKAFKKLAIKYHPDKTQDPQHHELFKKINEAYETLKSVDKRKEYDSKHHMSQSSAYTFHESTTGRRGNTTFHTSLSGGMPRNMNGGYTYGFAGNYGPGYQSRGHGVFSRHYNDRFSPEDLFEKERRAQKERLRKEAERLQQEKLEREAQRMYQAHITKLKQEKLEKLKQQQYQQHQRQSDEGLEDEEVSSSPNDDITNLQNQRKKTSNGHWSRPFQTFDNNNFQYSSSSNIRSSYRPRSPPIYSSRSPSLENNDADLSKGNSNDPIIVEDEYSDGSSTPIRATEPSADPNSNYYSNSDNDNNNFNDYTNSNANESNSDPSSSNPEVQEQNNAEETIPSAQSSSEPEVEEIGSVPSTNQQPESPGKTPEVIIEEEFEKKMKNEPSDRFNRRSKARKPHTFAFNDLVNSLNPDIGDVDFTEVKNSLPNYATDSEHNAEDTYKAGRSKKPRLSEYSNGTSQAETLHTPINKNSIKGHAIRTENSEIKAKGQTLTMLDFNASTKVRDLKPPNPPSISLDQNITKEVWQEYVKAIHAYQQEFFNYKTKIIIYQTERASRDKELFDLVNSHQSCFQVYQQCLDQDLLVMKEFHENLRQFNVTMESYKQHCHWKEMANLF